MKKNIVIIFYMDNIQKIKLKELKIDGKFTYKVVLLTMIIKKLLQEKLMVIQKENGKQILFIIINFIYFMINN